MFFLIMVVTLSALFISTIQVVWDVTQARIQLAMRSPTDARARGNPQFLTENECQLRMAVYESLFTDLSVPIDSTRFRPGIGLVTTDPSEYFRDESICKLCSAISRHQNADLTRLIDDVPDLNHQGDGGVSVLLRAVANQNNEAFELLLHAGASPDLVVSDIVPFRRNYCSSGFSTLSVCLTHYMPYRLYTLAAGYSTDINQQSPNGDSLLMQFMRFGVTQNLTVLDAILESGVDINLQNHEGETACGLASSILTAQFLIDRGADPMVGNTMKKLTQSIQHQLKHHPGDVEATELRDRLKGLNSLRQNAGKIDEEEKN